MSNLSAFALITVIALVILYRARVSPESVVQRKSHPGRAWSALGLLIFAYLVPLIVLDPREATELIDEGLSQSNVIRIFVSLVLIGYSIYLLTYKRMWARILHWPSFFLMLLVVLYLGSALWSVWPEATLFRALEVFAYFTVALFLATERNGCQKVYVLFGVIIVATLIWQRESILENVLENGLYRSAVSNQLGLIAASYTLLHFFLYPRRILGYVFGLGAMLAFGSTSTLAAFMVAAGIALGVSLMGRRGRVAGALVAVVGGLVFVFSLMDPAKHPIIMRFAVDVLGREEHHIIGATGRWVLWEAYFQEFGGNWIGSGFWAAERLFAVERGSVGVWMAINSHNGFWSAWIGAGVAAILLLLGLYGSIFRELFRIGRKASGLGFALITLLFLNSLTYPGIGGAASTWYFVLALVVALTIMEKKSGQLRRRVVVSEGESFR